MLLSGDDSHFFGGLKLEMRYVCTKGRNWNRLASMSTEMSKMAHTGWKLRQRAVRNNSTQVIPFRLKDCT